MKRNTEEFPFEQIQFLEGYEGAVLVMVELLRLCVYEDDDGISAGKSFSKEFPSVKTTND